MEQDAESATIAEIPTVHPLMHVETDYTTSWQEWLALWNKKQPAIFRESLLRRGFATPVETPEEHAQRVCLYMDIADGHCNIYAFKDVDESRYGIRTPFSHEPMTFQNARRLLAHEAFAVLSQNLFKNTEPRGDRPSWFDSVFFLPGVFEKTLWFFRPVTDSWNSSWARNLGPRPDKESIHHKTAATFLWELCTLGWRNIPYEWDRNRSAREILPPARPLLIGGLNALGKLRYLLTVNEVDEICLAKLCELAMEEQFSLPSKEEDERDQYRTPETLEEALWAGSAAAEVLMILRHKKAQGEKQGQLRKLKSQKRRAETELAKLASR